MLLLFSAQPVDRNQDELHLHYSWRRTLAGWEALYPSYNAGDSYETVGIFFASEGGQALEKAAQRAVES